MGATKLIVTALILAAVGTAGFSYSLWRHRLISTCPALDALKVADAADNARQALARRDHHLLMIGGYVGTVPGRGASHLPAMLLEGTGDTVTEACHRLRPIAEAYALAYNRAVIGGGL